MQERSQGSPRTVRSSVRVRLSHAAEQLAPERLLGADGLDLRTGIAIALVSTVTAVTGFLPSLLNIPVAYALTIMVSVLLVVPFSRQPVVLASSLVVVTAIGESALVTDDGRTLPALALAAPLLVATWRYAGGDTTRLRFGLVMPPRAIVLAAVLYLAVMALSIVPSTLDGVRPFYPLVYLAIAGISLVLALIVIPTLLPTARMRRTLVAVIAAMGPLLVLADVLLWLTGPIPWLGTYIGGWIYDQLTIVGKATPVVFLSPWGIYERPAEAATLLSISLIALLALRPSLSSRWRGPVWFFMALDGVALLMTTNRDGWLLMAVSAAAIAAVALRHGRVDRIAIAIAVVLVALLGALTLDVVGADLRQDIAVRDYGSKIAATLQGANADTGVAVRGGSTLSGRDHLWTASVKAIELKPITGWGIGQDQTAIGPLLPPAGQHLRGYTSDSTWLVAAVERGLPGLATLLLFVLASLYAIGRRIWNARPADLDPATVAMAAMFVGLLVGGTFETYVLGGLTFRSFYLGLAAGLAVAGFVEVPGEHRANDTAAVVERSTVAKDAA